MAEKPMCTVTHLMSHPRWLAAHKPRRPENPMAEGPMRGREYVPPRPDIPKKAIEYRPGIEKLLLDRDNHMIFADKFMYIFAGEWEFVMEGDEKMLVLRYEPKMEGERLDRWINGRLSTILADVDPTEIKRLYIKYIAEKEHAMAMTARTGPEEYVQKITELVGGRKRIVKISETSQEDMHRKMSDINKKYEMYGAPFIYG
ncbi:MAG: hypothetical protein ACP5NX_01510 [Candidatus Bilamarchaeaceae archaeon]